MGGAGWVRAAIATIATAGINGCTPSAPTSDAPPATSAQPSTPLARAIVDLTNAERTGAGLDTLREDDRLAQAAQIHAEQMARAGRLDHELAQAMYPRLEDRVNAVGYDWQAIGENLAFGQASASAVVDGWMRSSGHRENILNPAFTEVGAGHLIDASGRAYFVQVFARPRGGQRSDVREHGSWPFEAELCRRPSCYHPPVRVLLPIAARPGYQVFAYACHEGNSGLPNILSAARASERETAREK